MWSSGGLPDVDADALRAALENASRFYNLPSTSLSSSGDCANRPSSAPTQAASKSSSNDANKHKASSSLSAGSSSVETCSFRSSLSAGRSNDHLDDHVKRQLPSSSLSSHSDSVKQSLDTKSDDDHARRELDSLKQKLQKSDPSSAEVAANSPSQKVANKWSPANVRAPSARVGSGSMKQSGVLLAAQSSTKWGEPPRFALASMLLFPSISALNSPDVVKSLENLCELVPVDKSEFNASTLIDSVVTDRLAINIPRCRSTQLQSVMYTSGLNIRVDSNSADYKCFRRIAEQTPSGYTEANSVQALCRFKKRGVVQVISSSINVINRKQTVAELLLNVPVLSVGGARFSATGESKELAERKCALKILSSLYANSVIREANVEFHRRRKAFIDPSKDLDLKLQAYLSSDALTFSRILDDIANHVEKFD